MKTNPTTITTKLEPAVAQRLATQLKRATGEALAALLPHVVTWKDRADRKHEDLIRRAGEAPQLRRAVKAWDRALPVLHRAISGTQRRLQPAEPKDGQGEDGEQANASGQDGASAAGPAPTTGSRSLSGLDAAAQVLGDAGEALGCADIVQRMLERRLWSTSGKTPAATINAAIIREIAAKGDQSRFRKTGRGLFARA